jgi:hypothetical protein
MLFAAGLLGIVVLGALDGAGGFIEQRLGPRDVATVAR